MGYTVFPVHSKMTQSWSLLLHFGLNVSPHRGQDRVFS
jgi:hypothetical protein